MGVAISSVLRTADKSTASRVDSTCRQRTSRDDPNYDCRRAVNTADTNSDKPKVTFKETPSPPPPVSKPSLSIRTRPRSHTVADRPVLTPCENKTEELEINVEVSPEPPTLHVTHHASPPRSTVHQTTRIDTTVARDSPPEVVTPGASSPARSRARSNTVAARPTLVEKSPLVEVGKSTVDPISEADECKPDIKQNVVEAKEKGKPMITYVTLIGEGAAGAVHLIRHCGTLRAMKVIDKRAVIDISGRLLNAENEAETLKTISRPGNTSPYLVSCFYPPFQDARSLYLIMDFVQGGTLGDLIRRIWSNDGLSESEARFYTAEIALGMSHLHALGIMHRDLKPENILVTPSGHLKICDLGTASPSFCDLGLAGTVEYAAPEVILHYASVYYKDVDYYSLGITLFELLTGDVPFEAPRGENRKMYMMNVFMKGLPMVFPDWLSDEAIDLVWRLTQRGRKHRMGSSAPFGVWKQRMPTLLMEHPFFAGFDWYHPEPPFNFEGMFEDEEDVSAFDFKLPDAQFKWDGFVLDPARDVHSSVFRAYKVISPRKRK